MGLKLTAGVIGYPVMHSRSPAIHLAAAAAVGVDLDYRAIAVEPHALPDMIAMMREKHMRGLSVTMPHKQHVIAELDELTHSASDLGAVNHITNTDGHLVGNNTDGDGFLLGLSHAHNLSVGGHHVGVFGAGGAARAIIRACGVAGADCVSVLARNPERAARAAEAAGGVGFVASADVLQTVDFIVNATPVGMSGTPGESFVPFDVGQLRDDAVVIDIVYQPVETRLLVEARTRGLRAVDGLAMLAGQAAEQFQAWTGIEAPLDVMIAAARQEPPETNTSIR